MNDIRAALAQKNTKNTPTPTVKETGAQFSFWNTPIGATSVLRFLPDADTNNSFCWREKRTIKLPFNGVVGGNYPTDDSVTVSVPCMETWGHKCPITEDIRPLWKGSEDDKVLARVYYRKPTFFYSGFVVSPGFEEPTAPANPIRLFALNKSLHDIILSALVDPEIDDVPWDYDLGRDFRITVGSRGQFKDYGKSSFAMKPRKLTATERAAIAEHGLFNLTTHVGPEPTAETVADIVALYELSRAGEPFPADRFPNFRAFGDRSATLPSPSSPTRTTASPQATAQTRTLLDALRTKVSVA